MQRPPHRKNTSSCVGPIRAPQWKKGLPHDSFGQMAGVPLFEHNLTRILSQRRNGIIPVRIPPLLTASDSEGDPLSIDFNTLRFYHASQFAI